jgi:hypothetical protein
MGAVVNGASYLARFMARRSAQQAFAGSLGPVLVIDAASARFGITRKTFASVPLRRRLSPERKAVAEGSAIIITC